MNIQSGLERRLLVSPEKTNSGIAKVWKMGPHYLSDYDYAFPRESVAQEPLAERSGSRMLVVSRGSRTWRHARFRELPDFLRPGDLAVVNDTAVMPCRLFARKPTGGAVEIFLLKALGNLEWSVFLSPTRGLKEGLRLLLHSRGRDPLPPREVILSSLRNGDFRIRFASAAEEKRALEEYGETPLPPYLEREAPRSEDRERYQTVFAKRPGAVAAPTAGLHFSEETHAALRNRGVDWATLTLHVGPGTFLPVKTENIAEHPMHEEFYEIPESTLEAVRRCRERGGRILAVGTTSLRALESWAETSRSSGETELFIRPGFQFKTVDLLLTNFHQPKSTLLMLVSALAGREFILQAYREAIDKGYRLFSYGDCMLILP